MHLKKSLEKKIVVFIMYKLYLILNIYIVNNANINYSF